MKRERPAEVFHPAEFICEELLERGWTTEDVAIRMNTGRGVWVDLMTVDLFLCVHSEKLLLDDETAKGLARAFGTNEQFFRNLDNAWREFPDKLSPFTPPEAVFGETSRNSVVEKGPASDS